MFNTNKIQTKTKKRCVRMNSHLNKLRPRVPVIVQFIILSKLKVINLFVFCLRSAKLRNLCSLVKFLYLLNCSL